MAGCSGGAVSALACIVGSTDGFARAGFAHDAVFAYGSGRGFRSVPADARPVAQIGLSEKGMLSLSLTVEAKGGHSSLPPRAGSSAIGQLNAALLRLEAHQLPASLEGPGGLGLRELGSELPFLPRLALANTWLLEPLLVRQLSAIATTNALIRTTTAPTMIAAGVKDNVLPAQARAVVNFRIAPGDTIDSVKRHVRQVVRNPAIQVEECCTGAAEPSPVAERGGPGYRIVADAIAALAPDAVVTQGLVIGGTDSKHYARVSANVYRFLPLRIAPADLPRYHGTNERIDIRNYGEIIAFYMAVLRDGTR